LFYLLFKNPKNHVNHGRVEKQADFLNAYKGFWNRARTAPSSAASLRPGIGGINRSEEGLAPRHRARLPQVRQQNR
jgi:hypothetical protein